MLPSVRALLAGVLLFAPALATPAAGQAGGQEPALRVVVNIPAGRLYLYQRGAPVKSYAVSVGQAGYRTPTGSFVVRYTIWNPDWTPPDADWARERRYTPPGPRNPMGRVKIQLSDDYYIHGTVAENARLLGTPASHGCIRMSNADVTDLARRLNAYGSPDADSALLARVAADRTRTRWITLTRTVPVEIGYRVAEVKDGRLVVHPDVYGVVRDLRAEIRAALREGGYDPAAMDGAVVAVAERDFRQRGRATVTLPAAGRQMPDLALATTVPGVD